LIGELVGERVGCVFLVERTKTIAQLRLLLVEPAARGHGIGQRLVAECVQFAQKAGYSKMRLWTNDVLISARRIYQAQGFHLIEEERHASWGKPLTSQTWELDLRGKHPPG
jgi:GNAT superfamily N-acetyltransferase